MRSFSSKALNKKMVELIKKLSDEFLDNVIDRDSSSGPFRWPPLNEAAVKRVGAHENDFQAISLVFLLANDVEQAYKICQKIENKTFVPGVSKHNAAEHFLSSLILTANTRRLREGWHIQVLLAIHLIGRLKSLFEEMDGNGRIVLKNSKYETVAKRLDEYRYQLLDETRVKFLEVCQNLKQREANELYLCLKNNQEPSTVLDKDASPWPTTALANPDKCLESHLLELMQDKKPVQLLDAIGRILPQIVTCDFLEIFGQIFQDEERERERKSKLSDPYNQILHLKRGACLIINNERFPENLQYSSRDGSKQDEKALSKVWKMFGCEVTSISNLTREKMVEELRKFQDKVNREGSIHGKTFYSVVCILSHGRSVNGVDEIMGVDGQGISTDYIVDMFIDASNCPGMAGKLKLFLIQACRGEESQGKAVVPYSEPCDRQDQIEPDGGAIRKISRTKNIPQKSLFIIYNSTIRGCVSYRSRKDGSFFIQAICEELQRVREIPLDLPNILNVANNRMNAELQEHSRGEMTQCADKKDSLFGTVFLPPPNKNN